jgi:hypothetical protein
VRSPHEKRNVAVLFVAQALLGAQGAVHIILGGLAGALLARNQAYAALIILGLGWNFSFVGATSLLATTHSPAEQAKVQGCNDFLVLGLVSIASFSSGALLNSHGWNAVQVAVFPGLALGIVVLAWVWLSGGRRAHSPV